MEFIRMHQNNYIYFVTRDNLSDFMVACSDNDRMGLSHLVLREDTVIIKDKLSLDQYREY